MKRNLFLIAAAVAGLVAAQQAGNQPTVAKAKAAAPAPASLAAGQKLVKTYCVGCHNQKTLTANLALDKLDLSHPEQDPVTWERAIRKLRGGMMPPPGMPRPAVTDSNGLAAYLETSLDRASMAHPNPGDVRVHRLNRTEYANAMRDLFGITVDGTTLLPNDDISQGFDNIAKVLKVSPSFLDQYIMAARAMAKQAVGTPLPKKETRTNVRGLDDSIPLPPGARGGITAKVLFPYEGDYELRAQGNPAVFTLDGEKVDGNGRTHVKAGYHEIVAANSGRGFVESEGAFFGFLPGAAGTGYASTGLQGAGGGGGGRGRGGAGGAGVTVNGPFNPAGDPIDVPSRQKIFVCHPTDAREETSCASRIMSSMARLAFRRPVTEADMGPLMRFYQEGRKATNFEGGIENATVAMLSSAKFLYRTEMPPLDAAAGTDYKLSDIELASRLSFFLWSSIPDDALLKVAEQGKLKSPVVLEQQVKRMLADPRASTMTTNFAFSWLKVKDMATLDPDPYTYPSFDASLRAALRTEAEMFIESVFHEDQNVTKLLSANYTFLNERLAWHYGIPNVRGTEFRRVTLTDPNRFGLLGKGAILMVTAYPNRTSPVLRGSYILENILGTPPAPPPPNVPAFKENKDGEAPKTIRAIMEAHRANPTCNACHGVMDPLGFSLENFDTIGAYRATDRFTRTNIDTSGKLVDGTPVNGPADLRVALMKRQDQFVQTMTEKMMTYALGRGVEWYDMPEIRKIVRDSKAKDFKFSSLVMGIVNAPAFQNNRVEAAAKD